MNKEKVTCKKNMDEVDFLQLKGRYKIGDILTGTEMNELEYLTSSTFSDTVWEGQQWKESNHRKKILDKIEDLEKQIKQRNVDNIHSKNLIKILKKYDKKLNIPLGGEKK